MSTRNRKLLWLVQLAVLTAVLALMAFTPLGFLKIGLVEITFLTIPVTLGAMLCGPAGGAILGAAFGLLSFAQCFGMSTLGIALLAVNPFLTFVLCFVPRFLMGWLAGLLFKAIYPRDRTRTLSVAATAIAGPLLNTVLFVPTLVLLFGTSDVIASYRGDMQLLPFLAALVGTNGLIELIACGLLVFAIAKPLLLLREKGRL